MFICRMAFFKLHESPRFLVAAGRHDEAVVALRKISTFNGGTFPIELEDVYDQTPPRDAPPAAEDPPSTLQTAHKAEEPPSYDATGALDQPVDTHAFDTPAPADADHVTYFPPVVESPRPRRSPSEVSSASVRRRTPRWLRPFPRVIRRPTLATLDKLGATLAPEWRGTTLLVWAIWFLLSLGTSPSPPVRTNRTDCSASQGTRW